MSEELVEVDWVWWGFQMMQTLVVAIMVAGFYVWGYANGWGRGYERGWKDRGGHTRPYEKE